MSVASFSYIRISTRNSPCSSSSTACCSSSNSCFRYSATKSTIGITSIRSSQAEGPLRRPVAAPPQVVKPIPPAQPQPPPSSPPPPPGKGSESVITMEFQRQKAKEMQDYFKQKKIEEANQGPFFGFIGKNEISNGRWAMFGFAVGMLTEYATGSDFVDQVKILLSNFGIVDLD